MEIQESDYAILLTRNDGFIGRLIQWRYGCKYTHVGLAMIMDDEVVVYDSDIKLFSSGVTAVSFDNWRHKDRIKKVVIVPKEKVDYKLLVDALGKKYDLLAWFKHLGVWRRWKHKKGDSDSFTCWELVDYVLKLSDWWKAKPKDYTDLND